MTSTKQTNHMTSKQTDDQNPNATSNFPRPDPASLPKQLLTHANSNTTDLSTNLEEVKAFSEHTTLTTTLEEVSTSDNIPPKTYSSVVIGRLGQRLAIIDARKDKETAWTHALELGLRNWRKENYKNFDKENWHYNKCLEIFTSIEILADFISQKIQTLPREHLIPLAIYAKLYYKDNQFFSTFSQSSATKPNTKK